MRIIIIGAGPGGYETAVEAARRGIEVVIVSDGPVGGTCLNEGCIPTKTFCHYAELREQLSAAEDVFGKAGPFDFKAVAARKRAVVEQLRGGVEGLLAGKNITLVHGRASLGPGKSVRVGEEVYNGDAVIIATGSKPAFLPIPGIDLPGVVTSKEILDLEEVPQSLCVIGGGVIGLEFASVFRSFGTEVTVLEYCRDILPRFDVDLSRRLKQSLVRRGIRIETGACVSAIEPGLKVRFTRKDAEESVAAGLVLMAVGRKADLESLNLAEAGIEVSRRGVVVDDNFETSVPGIYAVGDITGGMMLAHTAVFQGRRALNHICGQKDGIRLDIVPAAVFTLPEAASVGLSEEECKDRGIAVKNLKSFYRANGKAVSMDAAEGYCKIVTDASDGKILGCHMLGAHAADLVQEITPLICSGATAADAREHIHAHPTLSEVIQAALFS